MTTNQPADGELKVGDVAHDLVKRGKVQIVGVAAESVAAHQDQEDYDIQSYKANALLDVQPEETVYSVVYLPDEPQVSFSGTYDFPESRLARVPIEAANDDLRRTQHRTAIGVLSQIFACAGSPSVPADRDGLEQLARQAGVPGSVVSEARELSEVKTVVGGDGS